MTTPSKAYDFGTEFQTLLLGFLFRDVSFNVRTDGLVRPEYFEAEVHGVLAKIATDYYRTYKTVPSKAALGVLIKEAEDKKLIRPELKAELIDVLREAYSETLADVDFAVEQVTKFARRQAMSAAVLKAAAMIDRGEYDDVEPIIQEASMVGDNLDYGQYDFFEEAESRYKYREEVLAGRIKPTGITTGYKEMDEHLYHHGWGRKELSVLMAPAKAGKSMSLVGHAMHAVLAGYNVLFVSLEVSTKIVADRLDANMAKVPLNDLNMQLKKARDQAAIAKHRAGIFKLHDFPSGTLRPSELRRLIHRYAAVGVKFDLVVVDYADLMCADREVDEGRENSRRIYLGLRAIAHEFDCAVLSATQTNREGFSAKVSEMQHVAEDINKVRTVDLLISLNPDKADKTKALIKLAASRNQAAVTFVVKTNLAMARFIEEITEVYD